MISQQPDVRTGALRLVRRHRRLLAGTAAAASIASLGLALQPPGSPTHPVVVAAADLPAGRSLAREDLVIAQVPAGVLPPGTFAGTDHLVGQVLSAPLSRGEVVGAHRLGAHPRWAVPAGTLPLPVRFDDSAAADLLAAGMRIDVVAAAGPGLDDSPAFASAELVATDVLVLEVLGPDPGADGILAAGAGSDGQSPVVVLAADRASGLAIAGAQARARLTFAIRPRQA
jgi:pilus assembly protein CpaB